MSLTRIAAPGVIVVAIVTTGPAAAQAPLAAYPGIGIGIGPGGAGPWVGPTFGPAVGPYYGPGLWGWGGYGWGWWPAASGSFWTNGNSLYGPPVPTGGIVPGTFGGSDAGRIAGGPPGLYDPWFPSFGSPYTGASKDLPMVYLPADWNGPRFATRDVRTRYAIQKAYPETALARMDADLARAYGLRRGGLMQPVLRMRVRVPTPDCTVLVQDQPMTEAGTERTFESPPLTPGTEYQYVVQAKFADGRTETKTVRGKAGDTVVVDFGGPGSR